MFFIEANERKSCFKYIVCELVTVCSPGWLVTCCRDQAGHHLTGIILLLCHLNYPATKSNSVLHTFWFIYVYRWMDVVSSRIQRWALGFTNYRPLSSLPILFFLFGKPFPFLQWPHLLIFHQLVFGNIQKRLLFITSIRRFF